MRPLVHQQFWCTRTWLILVALTGCDPSGGLLVVQIRTDFTANEIDDVITRVEGTAREARYEVRSDDPLLEGTHVAEFDHLAIGVHEVEVTLRDEAGTDIGRARVLTEVAATGRMATVVITRDCEGITCNGPSSRCLSGECIDERCTPEQPEYCPPAECEVDADCSAAAFDCVRRSCQAGVCFDSVDDSACPAGAQCDLLAGCVGPPPAECDETPPALISFARVSLTIEEDSVEAAARIEALDPTHSVLWMSVRQFEKRPAHGLVGCELESDRVRCVRTQSGTDLDGSNGEIHVALTIAEFGSEVRVQRGIDNTDRDASLPVAVNPENSFAVINGGVWGGTDFGTNEYVAPELVGTDALRLHTAYSGENLVRWQVVSVPGASVRRGALSIASDIRSIEASLSTPVDPERTILLFGNTADQSATDVRDGNFHGALDATSIRFERRGRGVSGELRYAVVELPYRVFQATTVFDEDDAVVDVDMIDFDLSRALLFSSNQSILGAGCGSGTIDIDDEDDDVPGAACVTLEVLDDRHVRLQRSAVGGEATVHWFAVDLNARECNGL